MPGKIKYLLIVSQEVNVSGEDFGLTPTEAKVFATQDLSLLARGFLNALVKGLTGLHLNDGRVAAISRTVSDSLEVRWGPEPFRDSALMRFGAAFARQLRQVTGVSN